MASFDFDLAHPDPRARELCARFETFKQRVYSEAMYGLGLGGQAAARHMALLGEWTDAALEAFRREHDEVARALVPSKVTEMDRARARKALVRLGVRL